VTSTVAEVPTGIVLAAGNTTALKSPDWPNDDRLIPILKGLRDAVFSPNQPQGARECAEVHESVHRHHGGDHRRQCTADYTGYDYDGTASSSNGIITVIISISSSSSNSWCDITNSWDNLTLYAF